MRIWASRMTDLRGKLRVWLAYGWRMAGVWLMVWLAAPAHADAWSEFETRCLAPIEDLELSHPADLKLVDQFKIKAQNQDIHYYQDPSWSYSIMVVDSADGERTNTGCGVSAANSDQYQPLVDKFDAWAAEQINAGRYEPPSPSNDTDQYKELLSVEFREPKVLVKFGFFEGSSSVDLLVLETDLES